MDIVRQWAEFEKRKTEWVHLEKALELPPGSINSEYEKELILSGILAVDANAIHKNLIDLSVEVIFSYETIISIHRRVKDTTTTKTILEQASLRSLNPHVIVDAMLKNRTEV